MFRQFKKSLSKNHYTYKEHPKISRIANFGSEMLENTEKYSPAKFANFVYICITRARKLPFLS